MTTTTIPRALKFSLLAALSLTLTCCLAVDPPKADASDQYPDGREHFDPALRPFNEALKIRKSHRFDLHPQQKKPLFKQEHSFNNDIVPDLQVGCGDGLLVESTTTSTPAVPKHKKPFAKKQRRKREAAERKPRSYFAYTIQTPASLISVWRPQPYRLERPYYIPVWGSHGRVPIYLPAQPVFSNPGFPLDNPPSIYNLPGAKPGTGYLPPSVSPTETTTATTPTKDTISNRDFIWGMRPVESSTITVVPTRRPQASITTSTFPPLVHNPRPNKRTTTNRPTRSTPATTTTPPPPPPRNEDYPEDLQLSQPGSESPHPCVWAIVSCCSPGSTVVNTNCFERLGCPGPFWDRSPCDSEFGQMAKDSALRFYLDK